MPRWLLAAWVRRACLVRSRSTSTWPSAGSPGRTARWSRKATSFPSTAPAARCISARCRSCRARSSSISKANWRRTPTRWSPPSTGSLRTPEDAQRARRFGAEGIGLCRTEHMFLGERRKVVERLILAKDEAEQQAALAELLPLQRDDFVGIFEAMDGLPVTVRLIDPPLHEFLPDLTDLSVRIAVAEAKGEPVDPHDRELLDAVRRLHEQNPMLGLRGVRLGLVIPGLFALQVRAIAEAAAILIKRGKNPRPEIMVPLVGAIQELEIVREEAEGILRTVSKETGVDVHALIGTMIEVPRAALTSAQIAEAAEFFSFGTNDLTQMTWGFSRDDVEGAFFGRYM